MKTGKRLLIVAAMAFAVLLARPAAAQLGGFNLTDQIKDILAAAIPPFLGVVTTDPEEPAAGEDVTVYASVNTMPLIDDETMSSVDEAYLYYSTDEGESWEEVEMEEEDDGLWTGEIPGQDSGTKVLYYVRAMSEVGDFDLEAMGKEITLDIGKSQAFELHEAANFGDDFEKLTVVIEDEDDAVKPKPFQNYESFAAGADDEKLYLRMKLTDKMDGGKMSPLNGNGYLIVFLDMTMPFEDFDARETSTEDYAKKIQSAFPFNDLEALAGKHADRLSVWHWLPLASSIGAMLGGMPVESILKIDPASNDPVFKKNAVSSEMDGGTVDLTIDRATLGEDVKMLFMLPLNLNITGQIPDNINVTVPDIAFPTFIKFVDHSYTVGD